MVALIITSSILALVAVILLSPISLRFSCRDGELSATVHYLFIKFDFSPDALAEAAVKKSEKRANGKQRKPEADKKTDESKGALDTVKTVISFIRASKKALGIIRRHLIIYKMLICVSVSCSDPCETGIFFGKISAFISTLLAIVSGIFTLKRPRIHVAPDFLRGKTRYDISFRIRILMFFIIWASGDAVLRFVKITLRNKRKRQEIKGGKKHEPTTAASN